MDQLDMVEKLREKTKVSYEEAKNALEQANWDLLDAILILEGEAKAAEKDGDSKQNSTIAYTTKTESETEDQTNKTEHFPSFNQFLRMLGDKIDLASDKEVLVEKDYVIYFRIPLLVLIVFGVFFFYGFPFILILILVSLFFGFRYSLVDRED